MLGRRSLGLASLVFVLLAVIPTATGRGTAADTWAGSWSTEFGPLTLTQTGTKVEGSYTHDSGHVVGTVSGNVFTGRWDEAPTRTGPSDAGAVIFTLQSGGKSFTGRWSYDGDPATFFTTWNGTCTRRVVSSERRRRGRHDLPPPAGDRLGRGRQPVARRDDLQPRLPEQRVHLPVSGRHHRDVDAGLGAVRGLAPALLELAHPVRGQVALHDHDGWRESRQGRLLAAADEPRLEPRRPHRGLRAGLRHSLRPRPVRDHREGGCSRRSGLSPPGLARDLRRGQDQVLQPHDARQQIGVRELRLGRRDRHHPAADHALRPFRVSVRGAGTVSGPRG